MKILKTLGHSLVILVLILTVFVFGANAGYSDSGVCDNSGNVLWSFSDDGILTIYGNGEMEDYSEYGSPFNKHSYDITEVVIGDGVTYIGDNAFYDFQNLKSVIGGKSIKAIGDGAFENAIKLNDIEDLSALELIGERAFKNTGLAEFAFGAKLKNIGKESFFGSALQSAKLLSAVESIGDRAFYSCANLNNITLGKNVSVIGEDFLGFCNSLTDITVDYANLNYYADDGILFNKAETVLIKYPSALNQSVYYIPETVTEISYGAFGGCKNVEKVILNEGLVSVGDYAFSSCTSLIEIDIPFGAEKIGEGAFSYCTSLENVTFSDSVNLMGEFAFCYCTSLKEVNLPESLTKISLGAFSHCSALEKVSLGSLIKDIETSAFSLCSNLKIVFCKGEADDFGQANISENDNEYFLYAPKHFDSHTVTLDEGTMPICVYDGYMSGEFCSECEVWLSGHEKIEAEYDAHDLGTYSEYKPSTCTEKGEDRAYCTRCDYYIFDLTELKSHEYSADVIFPTCSEPGYTLYKCYCGSSYISDYADTLEHSFSDYKLISSSTCTANGKERADCVNCSYYKIRLLPLINHSYSACFTTDVKATCNSAGSKSRHCVKCGAKTDITSIAKTSHSYSTVITPATAKRNGKTSKICTLCNKTFSSETIYKITAVKLSAATYTYDGKVKTPSVTVKNSKGKSLTKGKDYTLKYQSGRKKTGKYTVTVTFMGKYSGTKVLTFKIIPQAVKSFTAKPSTKSVTLSWKKVKGATGYRIYYYNTKTKKYVKLKDTEKLTYTVTKIEGKDLKYGNDYKFAVKAYKKSGQEKVFSSKSKTVSTATKPKKATLKKVTSSSGKINLKWSKLSCDGYEIVYATNKSFSSRKTVTIKKSSAVKYTLKKTRKGKTYYFKVRGYKTIGGKKVYGYYSTAKTVKAK